MSRYAQEFRRSLADPEGFWADAARGIDWYQPPTVVLDRSKPPFYRWFADGVLNTCFNAVDRHVRDGRGQQAALIYDSPVTGTQRTYTYAELQDEIARFAGVLRGLGVDKGDRVIVYLPMIPEALIAMLACARIGAVHSVVFGGFAAPELATRIDDATPKVIVSASCGIEVSRVIEYKPILDRAIELASHKPEHCVILQRPQATAALTEGRDLDWAERRQTPSRPTACRWRRPTRCTSCTPRAPRPGPRAWSGTTAGTRSRCAGACDAIYDTRARRGVLGRLRRGLGGRALLHRLRAAAGRVHHGALRGQAGAAPRTRARSGGWWPSTTSRRCSPRRPRSARSRRRTRRGELAQRYDLSGFRYLFLAGERLDPETYRWASELLGIPVIDHWWQTETGWPIVADLMGLEPMPTKAGLPDHAGARLRRAHPRRRRHRGQAGRDRRHRGAAAAAAGLPAHAVARRRAVRRVVPVGPSRLLHHGRRRVPGRRRLRVRDGPGRRRDQRGRAPAVHRADGGGAGQPPRRWRSAR